MLVIFSGYSWPFALLHFLLSHCTKLTRSNTHLFFPFFISTHFIFSVVNTEFFQFYFSPQHVQSLTAPTGFGDPDVIENKTNATRIRQTRALKTQTKWIKHPQISHIRPAQSNKVATSLTLAYAGKGGGVMQPPMSFSEMAAEPRWVDCAEILHSLWGMFCATFG